ncbi:MAG: hypothetical protein J5J06_13725 [Phycisphaerae bacterium]|nr:hypothetical protein [Phycisphaerae bacterium]
MNGFRVVIGVAAVMIGLAGHAKADMWDAWAHNAGLNSPHVDNCDSSTEVFISVGGGDLGFCMEKDDRGSAVYWEIARQNCAVDGKRLPSPAEYLVACDSPPTGLVNLSGDDWEWLDLPPVVISNQGQANVVVPAAGGTTCSQMTWGELGTHVSGGMHATATYRCIR